MYTRVEASKIKKSFWTAFGLYMKPVLNSEGEPVNWINYKTGIRHIYFRLDADKKHASVSIEIKHTQAGDRLEAFTKFQSVKNIFDATVPGHWQWQPQHFDEDGTAAAIINLLLQDVNIFNEKDWPAIISFFKKHIINLDAFWNMVKPQFE